MLRARALDLVTASGAAGTADHTGAVQHARNIAQTFAFATLDLADPASASAAQQLRDHAMADNVAWWQRHTGAKMLVSAHNGHAGYASTDPFLYPKPQGPQLRDIYGHSYVAVGLAVGFPFNNGSFLSNGAVLTDNWKTVTAPPATPDMKRAHPRPGPVPGLLRGPAHRSETGA
ncbi:erythromycin esterase family protein [Streptomyces sp. NPDC048111]|uniref:erythromycin esterase family protein n=1 Tax=Streptomyces sp. NPDC048111 TaxID=3365500 RepID=UPI0037126B9F